MRKILLIAGFSLFALTFGYEVDKPHLLPKQEEPNRFIAAILRDDGTLVPFAQYGNGGWFNPWPNPQAPPHSLGELPEPWFTECGTTPKTWYFWSSAATPAVLNASRVMQVENHSQTNWALLTDFSKQNSAGGHHRNIGVALNVNQEIEPLLDLNPESLEVANLRSFIKSLFDETETTELNKRRAEESAVNQPGKQYFPRSSEARAKVSIAITKLARSKSTLHGQHLYYFEAAKQYQKPANSVDAKCNDVSLFQGWLEATESGGLGLLDSQLYLTTCDMKGPSSATPLGIMTLHNKTFLFVSEHGWEDESYLIFELNDSGLQKILETFGG